MLETKFQTSSVKRFSQLSREPRALVRCLTDDWCNIWVSWGRLKHAKLNWGCSPASLKGFSSCWETHCRRRVPASWRKDRGVCPNTGISFSWQSTLISETNSFFYLQPSPQKRAVHPLKRPIENIHYNNICAVFQWIFLTCVCMYVRRRWASAQWNSQTTSGIAGCRVVKTLGQDLEARANTFQALPPPPLNTVENWKSIYCFGQKPQWTCPEHWLDVGLNRRLLGTNRRDSHKWSPLRAWSCFFSSLLDVTLHQLRLQSCVQVISD